VGFIADSDANRVGKGTQRAVDRLQQFVRRYRYVLRRDMVQFFPSLDLALLLAELRRHIRDDDTVWLCDPIMRGGSWYRYQDGARAVLR
jgi:hypothetical protein